MRLMVRKAIEGTRVRVSRKTSPYCGRPGTIIETPPERRGYYSKTQYTAVRVWVKFDGDKEAMMVLVSSLSLLEEG